MFEKCKKKSRFLKKLQWKFSQKISLPTNEFERIEKNYHDYFYTFD